MAESDKKPETHTIRDIDQMKALANPLRLRIVEALAKEPMTTKQVAVALGEKPTRLYHHVDLLEKAGLIRLQRTQQNRGTIEKYYEAIARGFRAGVGLFSDENTSDAASTLRPIVTTMLDRVLTDLLELLSHCDDPKELEEEGLLSQVELHVKEEYAQEVLSRLNGILEYLMGLDDGENNEDDGNDEDARKFRLTIAYYPTDYADR